jgi:glycosyltransferase involved in cell wall biosynthesis
MLKYEANVIEHSDQCLFFNAKEASYYNSNSVSVVPHGVSSRLFEMDDVGSEYADGVVIFGRMNFEPNINSVEWFIQNVMPLLPRHIKLYVVGADPCIRLQKLAAKNTRVLITGFVGNPYPGLRGAIANICPIQIGGGVQNKIIEGLAIGALGIISPLAAESMPEIEDSGLIICSTPEEWARSILVAESDRENFELNRNMSRQYAKKHFSWEAYINAVKKSILNAITSTK